MCLRSATSTRRPSAPCAGMATRVRAAWARSHSLLVGWGCCHSLDELCQHRMTHCERGRQVPSCWRTARPLSRIAPAARRGA